MKHLLRAAALVLCAAVAHAQEWQLATPESQGMDSAALAQLVEYGANVRMDSLVVVRNGRIVAEAYYAPFKPGMLHRINSSTKAVVGALAGIATARGDLPAPETPALGLFADAVPTDARWKSVTVQHLLDMTSGLDWTEPLNAEPPATMLEMERSTDWERFILARRMKQAPGAAFNYNSGNPHLLSAAIGRKAGVPLETYAREHLFAPLGIASWRWRKDPQQVSTGGFGLYLHTRDMARFGQLYLQGGQWNGRQVVPREWAARVFSPKVEMPFPGYLYADYWWSIPKRSAYFTAGFNRQVIMVLPKLGIVAAATGRMHWPFEDFISHLERAARSGEPLANDDAGFAKLHERIAAAAGDRVLPPSAPPQLPFTRATWKVEDNRNGITEFTIDLAASSYHVKLRTRAFGGALGFDGRFGEATDQGGPVLTTARWEGADTLRIEQRWPEEAGVMQYTLRFNGDELDFTSVNMFGVRGSARGVRLR
jgi:CubicO group peptidase (beta-lactamase class C family)